jgi:hypothetical protein
VSTPWSVLLGEVGTAAAGHTALFTCPVGKVAILTDVTYVGIGAPAEVFLTGSGPAANIDHRQVATGTAAFNWQGRQVFPAGSQLGVTVTSGTWWVRATGYLLSSTP